MPLRYKIIHAAFGLWALTAVTKISSYGTGCVTQTCRDARNAGTIMGIIIILVAWAAVLVIAKTFDK